jgi:hypothetical protein
MQQIKGISMEHILCPPCRYKMGIAKQVMEYDELILCYIFIFGVVCVVIFSTY